MSSGAAIRQALLLGVLLFGALSACNLPRDAEGATERAEGGVLRIGVVEHPPWATADGSGIENGLAAEVARRLGATPYWVTGTENELLAALHERELDLVIGGLTADSPWAKQVAFTKPYYADTIAVAPARATPHALERLRVAVRAGDPIAAELRKQRATPVLVRDLATATEPVAAPTWRLAALHRTPVGRTLRESQHVLATAPGENRLLVRVEALLRERKDGIPMALRASRP
jgi:polar amino acid transport system substrate-binding protein